MSILKIISEAVASFNLLLDELKIALERSGCQQSQLIIDEATHSLNHLQNMTEQQEIRNFLKLRAQFITTLDADYLALPYSPINQLCIKLAQFIATPDEPLITLLLPSLTIEEYDTLGSSLIELTEKTGANGERELDLTRFILSDDKRAIIPLIEWFECKMASADTPFHHHVYTENNRTLSLSENELDRLNRSITPESLNFFESWEWKEELKHQSGTLSALVLKLCIELSNNGEGHPLASSWQAAPGAYECIRSFFNIWNTLPKNIVTSLRSLPCGGNTLGYYLDYFEMKIDTEKFKDRDIDDERKKGNICIQIAAANIKTCVDLNVNQFSIVLEQPGNTANNAPDFSEIFKSIVERMKTRLHSRSQDIQLACGSGNIQSKERAYRPYPNNKQLIKNFYQYFIALKVDELSINSMDEFEVATAMFGKTAALEGLKNTPLIALLFILERAMRENKTDMIVTIKTLNPKAIELLIIERIKTGTFRMNFLEIIAKYTIFFDFKDCETTPLIYLAQKGYSHYHIDFLIGRGIDINQTDALGNTALHYATLQSEHFIFDRLIARNNLQVNRKNKAGKTALQYCIDESSSPNKDYIAAYLILNGASIDFLVQGRSIFLHAAVMNWHHVVLQLIKRQVDVNQQDKAGNTALHLVIANHGYVRAIGTLLENKADVNIKNHHGVSFFQCFLEKIHHPDEYSVINLCKRGASLDFKVNGHPFIIYAIYKRFEETFAFLIKNKTDLNQQDRDGNTPLHIACKLNYHSIIRLLLEQENCINLNLSNNNGWTPLQVYIMEYGYKANNVILGELMEQGARLARALPQPTRERTTHLFSRAVMPLQLLRERPVHSDVIDLFIKSNPTTRNNSWRTSTLIYLVQKHSFSELIMLRSLHPIMQQLEFQFDVFLSYLRIETDATQHYLLYAAIQASRLLNTEPDHPCYSVRQRKAEHLYAALQLNDLPAVDRALNIAESRFLHLLGRESKSIREMPENIRSSLTGAYPL